MNLHFARKLKYVFLLLALLFIAVLMVNCRSYEVKGGPVEEAELEDGIYRGTSRYGPVRVAVDVTIKDHFITEIELVRHFHGRGREAEGPVIESILRQQSTDVDAVTGATGSSIAIMNAVEEAVGKARK